MFYKNGQTSVVLRVKLLDSSSTTGAGLTGLTSASSGLIISTIADNESSATAYTVAGSTIETITTLGTYAAPTATKCRFKEVDSTNHKGIYEVQIADARFAVSNAKSLLISFSGATNLAQADYNVQLTSMDPYDAVHLGLSAIPNATAGAANGLVICGTNAPVTITGSGNALTISSTGANGHAVALSGNGTGDGLSTTGGATGRGLHCIGGATSGSGIKAEGTTNSPGVEIAGSGNGDGLLTTGGTTGRGIHAIGGATSGAGIRSEGTAGNANAIEALGQGSADGIAATGGATGRGIHAVGGATSGAGLRVEGSATSGNGVEIVTTSGDGLSILPTAGNGIVVTANGTSKHGAVITGGTAGTSDGIKAVAGTGGVDIRGSITGSLSGSVGSVTGNVAGNVSGSVLSVISRVTANTDQWAGGTIPAPNVTGVPLIDLKYTLGTISPATAGSVRADAVTGAVGSVTGNVGGNVTGSVGSVVGAVGSVTAGVTVTTNNDKTGYALTSGERTSVADALLDRDMSIGSDSGSTTVRTVRQALRFLRNKWAVATGTLTVYKEDDATSSWTGTISTDATAIPVVGNDPAGP